MNVSTNWLIFSLLAGSLASHSKVASEPFAVAFGPPDGWKSTADVWSSTQIYLDAGALFVAVGVDTILLKKAAMDVLAWYRAPAAPGVTQPPGY